MRSYPLLGQIDIWWQRASCLSEAERAKCWAWMSDEERLQHGRFLRKEDRLLYLATRGLVRGAFSSYESVAPKDWSFTSDEHGRPWVSGPVVRPFLVFNLSHSKDLVVCAISTGGALGIDVEGRDPRRDLVGIAKRFFAASEYQAILAAPSKALQERLFSSFWTLKEAYMKARGLGFALEPQWMIFSMEPQLCMSFEKEVADHAKRWACLVGELSFGHTLSFAASWGEASPIPRKTPRSKTEMPSILSMPPKIRCEGEDVGIEVLGTLQTAGVEVCFLEGRCLFEEGDL